MNTMESGPFMVWGKNTKNKARFFKEGWLTWWRYDNKSYMHIPAVSAYWSLWGRNIPFI